MMLQQELPAGPLNTSSIGHGATTTAPAPVALPPGAITTIDMSASAVPTAPAQPAQLRNRRRQRKAKGSENVVKPEVGKGGVAPSDSYARADARPKPDSVISLDASIPHTRGVDMAGAANPAATSAPTNFDIAALLQTAATALAAAGTTAAVAAASGAASGVSGAAPVAASRREELEFFEALSRSQAATLAASGGGARPTGSLAGLNDNQWVNMLRSQQQQQQLMRDSPIYVVTPETSRNWRGGPSGSLQHSQNSGLERESLARHGMGRAPVGHDLKTLAAGGLEQAGLANTNPSLSATQAAVRQSVAAHLFSQHAPEFENSLSVGLRPAEGNAGTGFRDALRSAGLPGPADEQLLGQTPQLGLGSASLLSRAFGADAADPNQTSGVRRAAPQDMARTYSDANDEDQEQVWSFSNDDISHLGNYNNYTTSTRSHGKHSGLLKPLSGSTICSMADRGSNHSRNSSISGSPAHD